jgi:thiol reductant ABC exporter CydC subunit
MKRTLLAVAAATATFAAAIGLVATGGWLISMAALQPPLLTLEVAIVSVRAFGIARGSFRWLDRVVSHDAALHDTVERRAHLWSALAAAGPRGAWALRRGDAVTRLMQDAEVLQDRLTRVVVPAAAALITAFGAVVLQLRLLTGAGLAFLMAVLVAGVLVPLLTHHLEASAARGALGERGSMFGTLSEFVQHRDEMRVLGIVDEVVADISAADARRLRIEIRAAVLTGLTQWTALVASGLAIVAGLMAAVPAVLDGSLSGPDLAVVVLLPWSSAEVIAALAMAASAFVRVRAAAERLAAVEVPVAAIPDLEPASGRGLEVRDLAVTWTDAVVVQGVSFKVRPGERVAIVGPSGAGKSTIVSALLGLVPYSGRVAVGMPDGRLARPALITAVPQAPHVFRTTTRENLRMAAGPVDDEALQGALKAVGLQGIDLDRDLGGMPLSGGEAQRLGLARALLTGADTVVLDEPTEHLDEKTAAQVMGVIRAATADRAVVMTTHRLTDLRDFDRIHVLGDGTIMCSGTYDQCLDGSEWFRDAVEWHLDKAWVD